MTVLSSITDGFSEYRALRFGKRAIAALEANDFVSFEEFSRKALAIMERAFGEIEQTAVYTWNVAEALKAQGRELEAAPFYERTFRIARAVVLEARSLGTEDPQLIDALHNLARYYMLHEQYAEAEPVLQQLLAIREKTSGPNDPDVADTLANIARAYEKLSKLKEAEALYRRAISIYERQPGPAHPFTATVISSLAALLRSNGDTVEANRLLAQAEGVLSNHIDLQPSDWLHPNARSDESR